MARKIDGRLIEGFRDPVSRQIANGLDRLRTEEIRRDLDNAAHGIPRDEAQAERWRRLGLQSAES